MKYTTLFIKMLFISCLIMAMGTMFTSCSDDENELHEGYGYVQFKLYKSASYDKSESTKTTRATTNELAYLRDAQKMKIVLINNEDATEIIQTVGLGATNDTDAEFGLRSEKLQLLAGEYTVVGYYLYKVAGQDLEQIMSCEPLEKTVIKIVDGGLVNQDLTVNAVKRGHITITLEKDIATRASSPGDAAYLFENIKYVSVQIKNKFLVSNPTITLAKLPVVYKEKVTSKDGKSYKYAVSVNDSLISLPAGTYEVVGYETLDFSKNRLEYNIIKVKGNSFIVEDNKTTEVFVPIYLSETAARIKDYLALKAIWEALDGKNWKYSGQTYTSGVNWNFDKEIDMWGQQPGVDLDANGRVIVLNLGSFGPKGDIPKELGDLTELQILTLGTHSDIIGENVFEKVKGDVSESQLQELRNDYYNKFLKTDLRAKFSEPLLKAYELKNIEVEEPTTYLSKGISLKDVSAGNLSNGIKSIPTEISKLTKLQQLFIANGLIETIPASINNMNITDLEIYNCPKMTKFPTNITKMRKLIMLNLANNPQMPSSEIDAGIKALATGNAKAELQMIYLGSNNITIIPEAFRNFTKLGKLDCSYNKITKIERAFGKGINLIQLSMDHNLIEEIPSEDGVFCGFEDVESFSFSYNKLKVLPDIFDASSVFVMGSVNFSNNEIEKIEGEDDGSFKGINASTISLAFNKLKKFPGVLFEKNAPITSLNLSGNGMTEFPDGSLSIGTRVYYLQSLDLTFNKLSKLPKEFNATRLPYLYGVDMSYNRFTKCPEGPLNIDHLVVYGLRNQRDEQGNRIMSEWPTGISNCPSLRALYLGGNDLRKITDTISYLIYMLEVRDNPNIQLDVSAVCAYIKAGRYILIYDSSQDIRGCDYLDLDK